MTALMSLLVCASVRAADPAPAVKEGAPVEDEAAKKAAWHGDVAFTFALTDGTKNTLQLGGSASANKEWGKNILKLGVDGQYGIENMGETNEAPNAAALHGGAAYQRLLSGNWYGDVRLDAYYNGIQEVHYRVIVGPAVGYYFIKKDKTKLNGDIGMSYVAERVGTRNDDQYWTIRFGEAFEHSFSKGTKVWEKVTYYPKINDFTDYLLEAEIGAEAALNTRMSMRVVFIDRYNSNAPPGVTPNDMSLLCSIVYRY
jgi:putative salt-induced outer membrane protein YdiY